MNRILPRSAIALVVLSALASAAAAQDIHPAPVAPPQDIHPSPILPGQPPPPPSPPVARIAATRRSGPIASFVMHNDAPQQCSATPCVLNLDLGPRSVVVTGRDGHTVSVHVDSRGESYELVYRGWSGSLIAGGVVLGVLGTATFLAGALPPLFNPCDSGTVGGAGCGVDAAIAIGGLGAMAGAVVLFVLAAPRASVHEANVPPIASLFVAPGSVARDTFGLTLGGRF